VRELRAEWTKLRTAPATIWLLLAVVALTVGVGAAATATAGCPIPGCAVDTAKTSLTGVVLGQAVVAVLAVLAVGGEYSTGMVRLSLAAMPRRTVGLAAKAAVVTGLVAAAASLAVAGSLVAGRLILSGPGDPALSLSQGPVLRAAAGSVLYLALIGLLSLGAATAVRDSAAAIGLVLGLLYVLPIVAQAVPDAHWRRHLQQVAPMSAGLAVQTTTDVRNLPVGPWTGLAVLAAWTAAAMLAGGLLLRVRDA
jgi:ABC-2 type transport system permease protein